MRNRTKIEIALAAVVFLFLLISLSSTVAFYNQSITFENGIKKIYSNNQNVYSSYFNKVKEASQVSDKYVDGLKAAFTTSIKARYGSEGSKAMFQFIQEHNPNFDAALYTKLMQIVESGRNDFQSSQTSLLDMKQSYETFLGTFPNNTTNVMFGFPRIDMTKFDIVTNDETDKAFETKKAGPIDLKN